MCGRITLTKNKKSIIKDFAIDSWRADDYSPSYNIAPSQFSPILVKEDNLRIIRSMQWGLSSDIATNCYRPINIRLETLLRKSRQIKQNSIPLISIIHNVSQINPIMIIKNDTNRDYY